MPRDGSNIYSQPFPDVVEDTTIESTVYNGFTNDVATDLNTPRPIVAGGTAATNADDALTNLSAEKASQIVTNYDSMVWKSGSFYSATTATGEPVDGHAFSGIVYLADSNNIVLEARDSTDGRLWIRRKVAGVWGAWVLDNDLSGITTALDGKVDVAGDTMTGMLVLPATVPTLPAHATNKAYVDTAASGHVRYDAAQTLTSTQQAQARANIDVTKKNYIVNGAMMVSQENGTTGAAIAGVQFYAVDQFFASAGGTTGTCAAAQIVGATPGGSTHFMRVACTVADAAVAAGDIVYISTRMEGLRVADLKFGTAAAKTITIQFGVIAPAGTYSLTIGNTATSNRSYVAEYVITAGEAMTSVVKSVTIPGDVTGTWAKDNTVGLILNWGLMVGTTYQQAAGSWGTGAVFGSPNQFNLLASTSNSFSLFDVSLTEGTIAPPFQVPDYASELALCMRYYEKLDSGTGNNRILSSYPAAGQQGVATWQFKTRKRITPTCAFAGSSAGSLETTSPDYVSLFSTSTYAIIFAGSSASARL